MTGTGTAQRSAAPLGSVGLGSLVFTRGASHLTIGVDGSMEDLYRASFDGKAPEVRVEGGTVAVRYRPSLRRTHGEIILSGRVPWDIKANSGMSNVVADLGDLELRGLDISGGSSHLEVRLPRPKGTVRVRVGGGASDFVLIRPADVPVRMHAGAGVSNLAIDDLRLGPGGGKTDWQSPDFDQFADRYDIEIGAGASTVTIRS